MHIHILCKGVDGGSGDGDVNNVDHVVQVSIDSTSVEANAAGKDIYELEVTGARYVRPFLSTIFMESYTSR